VRINTDHVFDTITSLVHERADVSAKMSRVIDACESSFAHAGWSAFRSIAYEEDAARLRQWLPRVLSDEPPEFEIRGAWFGIATYVDEDDEFSDLHFIGARAYDPDDRNQEWAVRAEYRPSETAGSEALERIYRIANTGDNQLGNDAEWSLCLAYAVFAVEWLLRTSAPFSSSKSVGVVVGFDEGDTVTLGPVEPSRRESLPC